VALLQHAAASEAATSVWQRPSGWRLGEHRPARYQLGVGGAMIADVAVRGEPGAASVAVGGRRPAGGSITTVDFAQVRVEFAGESRQYDVARTPGHVHLGHDGVAFDVRLPGRAEQLAENLAERLADADRIPGAASPEVRSPMPGTIVSVPVTTGERVAAGQTLATIEAMKMEHKLVANQPGIVTIAVAPGDLVRLDQIVATVTNEPATAAPAPNQGEPR
jgi:acetyl-CoA/propionyl-CoA carboxylase biotin carboxyl carrier protein